MRPAFIEKCVPEENQQQLYPQGCSRAKGVRSQGPARHILTSKSSEAVQ
jgi:hypothetical protein